MGHKKFIVPKSKSSSYSGKGHVYGYVTPQPKIESKKSKSWDYEGYYPGGTITTWPVQASISDLVDIQAINLMNAKLDQLQAKKLDPLPATNTVKYPDKALTLKVSQSSAAYLGLTGEAQVKEYLWDLATKMVEDEGFMLTDFYVQIEKSVIDKTFIITCKPKSLISKSMAASLKTSLNPYGEEIPIPKPKILQAEVFNPDEISPKKSPPEEHPSYVRVIGGPLDGTMNGWQGKHFAYVGHFETDTSESYKLVKVYAGMSLGTYVYMPEAWNLDQLTKHLVDHYRIGAAELGQTSGKLEIVKAIAKIGDKTFPIKVHEYVGAHADFEFDEKQFNNSGWYYMPEQTSQSSPPPMPLHASVKISGLYYVANLVHGAYEVPTFHPQSIAAPKVVVHLGEDENAMTALGHLTAKGDYQISKKTLHSLGWNNQALNGLPVILGSDNEEGPGLVGVMKNQNDQYPYITTQALNSCGWYKTPNGGAPGHVKIGDKNGPVIQLAYPEAGGPPVLVKEALNNAGWHQDPSPWSKTMTELVEKGKAVEKEAVKKWNNLPPGIKPGGQAKSPMEISWDLAHKRLKELAEKEGMTVTELKEMVGVVLKNTGYNPDAAILARVLKGVIAEPLYIPF
jgi:hypothetical protein